MTQAPRVVIVGAGIGGLSAAIALRRRGIAVMVLERADALHEVGAGILLWPNAMRVLRQLDVGAAVERAGAVASHNGLRSWRRAHRAGHGAAAPARAGDRRGDRAGTAARELSDPAGPNLTFFSAL